MSAQDDRQQSHNDWALILGASSGFGEATAIALAKAGFHIFGVHLDRRSAQANIDATMAAIEAVGRRAKFFNVNAAAAKKRAAVIEEIASELSEASQVRVLFHSLAFGALKDLIALEDDKPEIDQMSMDMTVDVMAHSLIYWSQDLVHRKMMRRGGRILAMTSSGSQQTWRAYGAVSAAKSALESHCRQLAFELAPLGITANALLAGVTDTPALRKIPGHEEMIARALARNPHKRLTEPKDVASAVVALSGPESYWINGNTLYVDGGEMISGT